MLGYPAISNISIAGRWQRGGEKLNFAKVRSIGLGKPPQLNSVKNQPLRWYRTFCA